MKLDLKMKTTTTFLMVFAMSVASFAQKDVRKADKQFKLKAYELAIENYELELKNDSDCTHCVFQIAESYRLMNQNLEAAIWYRKLEGKEELPNAYFMQYGNVMKKMGQYNKAEALFASYANIDPITSNYLILSCNYAKDILSEDPRYEVSLYQASSTAADYGPAVFKDKIMYSSFRNDYIRSNNKVNESVINTQGAQLFVAPLAANAHKNNIKHLRTDLEEDYQVVSICYANDYKTCVITRSPVQHKSLAYNETDNDLSIFTAQVDEHGNFYNVIPFPHNEVGYATAFATLNPAGNIMYFSSNRPGGMGGYDIYASYKKEGMWTYPDNLGAAINTPGNEITPSFDGNDLFFSSDYHFGLGGYDLFKSHVEEGQWVLPSNLGNGVNSPEDDLYGIKHPNTDEYYVSSNRLGGKGNHDIYILKDIMTSEQREIALVEPVQMNDEVVPLAVTLPEIKDNGPKLTDATVVSAKVEEKVVKTNLELVDEFAGFSDDNPPPAVRLADVTRESVVVTKTIAPEASSVNYGITGVSVNAAKMVSYGHLLTTGKPVYFIQLAAFFTQEATVGQFSSLADYGNLYKIKEASATKVKLGYYYDEYEAKRILQLVKNMGYTDAFISLAPIDTKQMELVINPSADNNNFTYTAPVSNTITYKVRLASYSDPSWFDLGSVEDLGTIEQWSKNEWTIFVLSGYSNWENAETARIKAVNRGYVDASVVKDNNGVLETIKNN